MARKLIAGLAVLALAAIIATPAALGWEAERTYTRIVQRVNADNRDVAVRIDEYERGWLTARARYTVSISGPYGDAFREISGSDRRLRLEGRDRISHGPWADGRPAIARIDSEVRMTEALSALGQDAIADDPVVHARSVIGLGGDVRSRFRVPDHRFEAAVSDPEGEVEQLTVEWRNVSGDAAVTDGTTHFTVLVREMTLRNDGGDRLALSGVEIDDRSQRSAEGLRLDRARLSIERLELQVDAPESPLDLRVERLAAANEMDLAGDHAEITSLLTFERALANGVELTDAEVETRMGHLRREPLVRLQALMNRMQREAGPGDDLEARDVPGDEIRAALADLLRGSPRLESERLQVDTREGRVSGDVMLAFDGEGGFDVDVPATLLGPLSGRLELYVPRTLVRNGLYSAMREQLPGGELGEDMDARLRRQAGQTIDLFLGTGLLDEVDGRLVVRIDKEAGGPALLNNQDIMRMLQAIAELVEQ